jgi:hypothetical protein
MRRLLACLLLALLAIVPLGCGGTFALPTEHPKQVVPTDQSYAMLATWKGMDGVQDLIITQGQGNQLFVLFNDGVQGAPTDPIQPHGAVKLFPLTNPNPIGPPYFEPMQSLFKPVAIAAGRNRMFVLDQGDSCMAKYDARRLTCEADPETSIATGHPYRSQIFNYAATWRVREYTLGGGDTISTFTDTTVAQPYGIAVDDAGRIYVSCIAVFLDSLQTNKSIRTRKFVSRVYRYVPGQRYPGVLDPNMLGTSSWYRDSTWTVLDGSGSSSISDARGIFIPHQGADPLYIADRGNNAAKAVSSEIAELPILKVDGQETGASFNHPEGIAVDLAGFFYVVDRDNKRVLRYSSVPATYVQRVDVELNSDGLPLADPIRIAVDDSLAYIGDRGRGQIIRYKRRQ